jgi:ribonuclease R
LPEAELIFNDEGAICGVARSERNIAHRLIEEFMLVANETVARHLASLGAPLIYRIHEEPTPLKIEEFASIAESFGHRFSVHGPIPQRGFQHVLKKVRGRTEEKVLSYLMLRSMERARYSEQNLGHFGLAMKTYTHFTSPIRRYPDLAVHRMLREILESGGEGEYREQDLGRKRAVKVLAGPLLSEEREQELRRAMTKIAESSTERERTADNAERELMDWRKAQFIASCIGDHFDGVITTVKDYGFYVELLDHFVEGLVHVSMLRDDRYEFEERKFRLIGQRSGRIYKTGDRVRVSVDRVDKARHLIDFSLAGR